MKNSSGKCQCYLFMLFQFCSCLSTFFYFIFFLFRLNNKPCYEPQLVSSVMADYISTYYFFVPNSINNFHNLSARNILLGKYSFLETRLIKNVTISICINIIPSFYHDIQAVSFNYRSKGHKANRLHVKHEFTGVFEYFFNFYNRKLDRLE